MSNPAPTLNQINAFNATQGTTIDFNIIGGTELVRSNRIYIYDLSDNSLICTHLYVSTESIHELPSNTDASVVYESGKSSADFINGAQYYAQIQTFTDTAGTQGGSGLSVAKMFWCLNNPTLTINTIPSTISTTSYNVSATYNANTSVVSNIIQQYQFSLYSATGSLLQSSGVVVGNGTQQGTSTAYDISYNFTGLSVGSSYYVVVDVTTTQGMNVSTQSNTFTVSIDTPTVGGAIVNNNACDGYISVVSNLSDEYGGSASGEMASFETDSVNNVSSLKVNMEPIQEGSGTPSPTNIRPIRGHSGVNAYVSPTQSADDGTKYSQEFDVSLTPTSTDKVPYTFKAVGRDVYGDRESDKIVGGTVAWNQLVKNTIIYSQTDGGITFTVNSNGSVTFSGTATKNVMFVYGRINYTEGHKYAEFTGTTASIPSGVTLRIFGDITSDRIKACTNSDYWTTWIKVASGTAITTPITVSLLCFDLTQMFGSTIADYIYSLEQSQAGAGVAWFRNYFPKDYYPYDPGTLRSVEGVSAHETVGFNQWDEEWRNGYYSNTGEFVAYQTCIANKNHIRVTPGATYYFMSNTARYSAGMRIVFRDSDGATLSSTTINGNVQFDVPENCYYIDFSTFAVTGVTTYNHDICINLSDPSRNGEYEPYVKHTYPLDGSLTLLGVPKLVDGKLAYDGDVYQPSGEVQRRYGLVDLGTLTYNTQATGTNTRLFYSSISDGKPARGETVANAISPYAETKAIDTLWSVDAKGVGISGGGVVAIRGDILSPSDFKTAMSGVYMVYEKATPTTETAEPYTNPQVVDNRGTEAYVTTGIVPVGHDTTYLTRDIFGGTLDLVTGVLTVDRKMITLDGSENWAVHTYGGNIISFKHSVGDFKPVNANQQTSITDKFVWETYAWAQSSKYDIFGSSDATVYFRPPNSSITTLEEWKSWLVSNPTQLVYELATPQTYQLTPHQIQTLVGQNNVWSDAGDVEVTFNLPISNLLVKRQDASDVSGNWLTLYSQPITQASDMDFTFIDFLNQYGKTYKYALVPLLTQTQSGVEVEVEGGYTVSDEVNSIFDGVYIADQTNVERVKAGVGYGNIDMNQGVGSITPIGSKYPIVITNSQNQYHNGSIRGTIVPNDFYSNGNLSRIDMVNKRDELEQFLTNKRAKIIKDWNGKMWLVMIMSNVSCSFDDNYGMGMVSFSADWLEVGDPTSQQDLYNAGLINVGGV